MALYPVLIRHREVAFQLAKSSAPDVWALAVLPKKNGNTR
jgi:hypothetical protein